MKESSRRYARQREQPVGKYKAGWINTIYLQDYTVQVAQEESDSVDCSEKSIHRQRQEKHL